MRAAADSGVFVPLGVVTAVVSTIGVILTATITALLARRSHRDSTLRDDLIDMRARLEASERRLEASERRERIRDDYEHQLRADLEAAGLPVRPWPEGLTT